MSLADDEVNQSPSAGHTKVSMETPGETAPSSAPPAPPAGALARLRHLAWRVIFGGNVYDRSEFAGAFGDLGTFIPFVVAYINVNKMDPLGILLGFGIFKIFVGLYFKTPVSACSTVGLAVSSSVSSQAHEEGYIGEPCSGPRGARSPADSATWRIGKMRLSGCLTSSARARW